MKLMKAATLMIAAIAVLIAVISWQAGMAADGSGSYALGECTAVRDIISVSGSADVLVVPDEAVITLGIDSRDRNLARAKADNDAKVKAVIDISRGCGIDSRDIQLDYIDIRPCDITVKPMYDPYWEEIPTQNLGYMVRKKVVITLKDLDKFEVLLTDVIKCGVEYVQGVNFKTSELRKYKDQARELAVKAAREKADAMTAALGQKAGKAVMIREEQEYYWSWYDSWYWGWYGRSSVNTSNVQNVVASGQAAGEENAEGVVPGQIKVRASVSIDFILE